MSLLKPTRSAQWPLVAYFRARIGADSVLNTSGVETNLKATSVVADVINLPNNAIVTGGFLTVVTVSNESGTATLAVGDADAATRYLAATSIKAAATTAFTVTGYLDAVRNLRITLANQNGDATAGEVLVAVEYILDGRATEVTSH